MNTTTREAYNAIAAAYAATVDTKPYNAYYERPATLSLLPDVKGMRVLDAGCGSGTYTELLLGRGAEVIAIDASDGMVEQAQARVGSRAQVLRAEIGQTLDFLADESLDLVLSPLAIDYVENWHAVFSEFYRVLRAPGYLVFSINHPFFDFLDFNSEQYFATEAVSVEYSSLGNVRVPTFRRPLNAVINPLVEAGFSLERLVEPQPTEEFRQADPERYEVLMRRPMFLCLRARKG